MKRLAHAVTEQVTCTPPGAHGEGISVGNWLLLESELGHEELGHAEVRAMRGNDCKASRAWKTVNQPYVSLDLLGLLKGIFLQLAMHLVIRFYALVP